MKIKNLIIMVLVACIFTNIYILYKYNKIWASRYDSIESNYITFENSIFNTLKLKTGYDNLNIKDYLEDCKISATETYVIENFQNKLLLIIPDNSCSLCYDEVYSELKFAKDSLNIDIKIITTIRKYREIKNKMTDYSLSNMIFYIKSKDFFYEEISNAPYFMFVDSNYLGKHLFIPLSNHSNLTNRYIKSIHNRYFI